MKKEYELDLEKFQLDAETEKKLDEICNVISALRAQLDSTIRERKGMSEPPRQLSDLRLKDQLYYEAVEKEIRIQIRMWQEVGSDIYQSFVINKERLICKRKNT